MISVMALAARKRPSGEKDSEPMNRSVDPESVVRSSFEATSQILTVRSWPAVARIFPSAENRPHGACDRAR